MDAAGHFAYPPGVKPWVAPSAGTELDDAVLAAVDNDLRYTILIPKGCSRAIALERVYHEAQTLSKRIWVEYLEKRSEALVAQVTAGVFQAACREKAQAFLNEKEALRIEVNPSGQSRALMRALLSQLLKSCTSRPIVSLRKKFWG